MDMLEHHLDSNDSSNNVATKEENSSLVIEDAELVDCEGDAVSQDGVRYQDTVAYRVVQVNGGPNNNIELPATQAPLQVLTSPINGQFYVIGSANDVFTTAQTSRSVIAPRAAATLQIETPRPASTCIKKRDDRRRATHNEVERRRRDKINNWIAKLGKIIPECNPSTTSGNSSESGGKSNYDTQSKGGILAKACEYITELTVANQQMTQCMRENEKLNHELTSLKQSLAVARRENAELKSRLSGITEGDSENLQILP